MDVCDILKIAQMIGIVFVLVMFFLSHDCYAFFHAMILYNTIYNICKKQWNCKLLCYWISLAIAKYVCESRKHTMLYDSNWCFKYNWNKKLALICVMHFYIPDVSFSHWSCIWLHPFFFSDNLSHSFDYVSFLAFLLCFLSRMLMLRQFFLGYQNINHVLLTSTGTW